MMNKLKGIFCPSITLFNNHLELDIKANENYWERLIDCGVDGVVILGTIGENSELNFDQKVELLKAANDTFAQTKVNLIVGCSFVNSDDVVRFVSICDRTNGVSGLLSLPPYYFSLTQDSVKAHFGIICERTSKPVIAYNYPERNGINLRIDTLLTLKNKYRNFCGIKNTCKNLEGTINMISQLEDDNFTVYAGFDEHFLPALCCGGLSVISGLVNIIPSTFISLEEQFKNNSLPGVVQANKQVIEYLSVYYNHPHFVAAIKNELLNSGIIPNAKYKGIF